MMIWRARVRQLQMRTLKSFSKWTSDPTVALVSIRRVAAQTGLRRMPTRHIIHHGFHLFSYRIQAHQLLSATAINTAEMFANTMLQQLDASEIGVENIWFSDKAYFFLGGHRQLVEVAHLRNGKSPMLQYYIPSCPQSHDLGHHFLHLSYVKRLLQRCLDILREFVEV